MTKAGAAALVCWAWLCGSASAAEPEAARAQVATLDGAPVYHWRAFVSQTTDDVDRALVLREFGRRGFKLPEKFVDQEVQAAVKAQAEGSEAKFVELLRRQGATLQDYRKFVAEEITIAAMFYQAVPDERAKSGWLADLRANARVNRLRSAPNASK